MLLLSRTVRVFARGTTLRGTGAVPIASDLNNDNRSEIGVYKNGVWYVDANGNGIWESSLDRTIAFGASGQAPVVGIW